MMSPKPRKSLMEMARGDTQPKQIAGMPADGCPYCGCVTFVDGVNRTEKEITRYIECRNKNCKRRFLTYQPAAKILREIGHDNSVDGKATLSIVRKVG